MSDQDGRRHKRFPVHWAVDIEITNWNDALTLTTENISRGGLFVRAREPVLEPGSAVSITLQLPDGARMSIDGEVVHSIPPDRAQGDHLPAGFGVRFDSESPDLLLLEAMAASHAAGRHRYRIDPDFALQAVLRGEDGFERLTLVQQVTPEDVTRAGAPVDRAPAESLTEIAALSDLDIISEAVGGVIIPTSAGRDSDRDSISAGGSDPLPAHLAMTVDVPAIAPSPASPAVSRPSPVVVATSSAGAETIDRLPSSASVEVEAVPVAAASELSPPPPAEEVRDEAPPPLPVEDDAAALEALAPPIPEDADASGEDIDFDDEEPPSALEIDPEQAIFGIDFGTSYTSIALVVGDQLLVLHDEEGQTLLPSVVCYPEQGEPAVGWRARELQATNPTTTFVSPKRLIGRRFDDSGISGLVASSAVRLKAGPGGLVISEIYGEPLALPQVCAEVFRRIAEIGQRACSVPVRRVVLAAPVAFRDEREAIKRAAKLAGLEVVGMLAEPYAASLAYGLGREDQTVAVFDFGGGTFDFTLLRIERGSFDVLGQDGDPWLGGDDFDVVLANWAADAFHRERHVELRDRAVEWQRLLFLCERAKRKLSLQNSTQLVAKGIVLSIRGAIDLNLEIDRETLERLAEPLVQRSIDTMNECFERAGKKPSDVDTVVMTGGVSRMPLVRRRVSEYFGKEITLTVDPEQAIVVGTALFGRFKSMAEAAAKSA